MSVLFSSDCNNKEVDLLLPNMMLDFPNAPLWKPLHCYLRGQVFYTTSCKILHAQAMTDNLSKGFANYLRVSLTHATCSKVVDYLDNAIVET